MRLPHDLNSKATALIVIDIQEDGCSPEGKGVTIYKKKISQILQMLPLLKKFITVVKQKGVMVIYSRHIEDEDLVNENTRYLYKHKSLDFGLFKKESRGSKIYYLKPDESDIVLEKNTWDVFSNSELDMILRKRNIKNLIITGVRTECCVFSTVSSGFKNGYNIFVPKELVSTLDHKIGKYHNKILQLINNYYGFLLSMEKILASLR